MEKIIKADTLTALARATVEEYVKNGVMVSLSPECLSEYRDKRAGAFVTLYMNGKLRGCIGTILPVQDNLITEIINNSISSCSRDPRFYPVKPDELQYIKYSVSVLMPPEPIDSIDKLDPQRYGVIVSGTNNRRGLLLPRLESINTVEEQVFHAMAKGGIRQGETISLARFESIEHKEE